MYFDFKITAWERCYVPEEYQQEVFAALKRGEITSTQGVYDYLEQYGVDPSHEVLAETDTQMTVAENNGEPTIFVTDEETRVEQWCNARL
jgi:sugar/nucleoside kinase (ribokinase family)